MGLWGAAPQNRLVLSLHQLPTESISISNYQGQEWLCTCSTVRVYQCVLGEVC